MAEGVQLSTFNARYFCYHCNREVSVLQSVELACPECSGGFLEEVSEDTYNSIHDPEEFEDESDTEDNELNLLNLLSLDRLFRRTVVNALSDEVDSPRQFSDESEYEEPDDQVGEVSETPPEGLHSVHSIIQSLQLQMVNDDRFQHLGDYLFQDDIDAISTLIFNEAETVGPPPLPKEQIKLLPTISVSKEHIEKEVQCTVCMEDFNVREKAKCLPCEHFFHEPCITPWLERHATCPNCRKIVETQSKSRRSQSCPRTEHSRNTDQRRFSESSSSLSDFFSTSMSPFRFL